MPFAKLSCVEAEWRRLECGKDMTYFQSYDWNCMLKNYLITDNKSIENIIAIVRDTQMKAVMIAPIMVIKKTNNVINKKGFYFVGMGGWSDYLNCIYLKFDSCAFEVLLSKLEFFYKIKTFYLNQIMEGTSLYCYLRKFKKLKKDLKGTCVRLCLPDTVEEYMHKLSKKTRQNIRTAYNRLRTDGFDYMLNFHDSNPNLSECNRIRSERVIEKKYCSNVLKRWLLRVYSHLKLKYPDYLPFYSDVHRRIMTFCSCGKLRSFFNYGYSHHLHTIYVMAVGTDNAFGRYSPGILLMHAFICDAIEKKELKYVDFTRGNERYKYDLGGEDHYIHSVIFTQK